MKLEITKHSKIKKRNIFGKDIEGDNMYTIDCLRFQWFMIFPFLNSKSVKFYLRDNRLNMTMGERIITSPDVKIEFVDSNSGTIFNSEEDARKVLDDINLHPDKYWENV